MLHDNEVILDQANYLYYHQDAIDTDDVRDTGKRHQQALAEQVKRQGFVRVV